MTYQAIYLIKPSVALQERLAADPSDLADLLSEPAIWTKNQSDRSSWMSEDHLAQVKLLFLAHIHQEYSAYAECRQLLGNPPFGLETFDRWWTIEPYFIDERAEEIESHLDRSAFQGLARTSLPAVDQWLSSLQGGVVHGEQTNLSPNGSHTTFRVPQS